MIPLTNAAILQSPVALADEEGMRLLYMRADVRDRPGGFTLLELMVAVVIIGTLAAISLPMFMTYQYRTKSAEADTNLGAIATAERAYFSEFGQFLTVAPEPPAIPGPQALGFNALTSGFAELGFAPEGTVYFSYGVQASADGVGFTADAGADIDGNGFVQFWGFAKPDSAGVLAPGQVGCNVAALTPLTIAPCDPLAGRTVF